MIELTTRVDATVKTQATVTLPIDKRIKCRLKVVLDDGRDAGIFLDRGDSLQHGDKLQSADGLVVEVLAADETVSVACCEDPLLFARACYHLGNRHVPLQIVAWADGAGELSYLHDHVLDQMLEGLGVSVAVKAAPFNPEAGAYGGGHAHSHDHDHGHSHSHAH